MVSKEYIDEYYNNNKSGKMSSVKYIINHYIEDYNIIMGYSPSILDGLPFKERVWHTINKMSDIITCDNSNCDNPVKFKNSTIGYKHYCSNRCIGLDPKIKKQKEESNLKKFGTKHASLSEEVKSKVKDIYDNRTDGEKELILNKRISTVQNRYGVDNVNQLDEIISKRVDKFKENIDTWKENYKKTSLKRYGVDHPWKSKEIHNKSVESSNEIKIQSAKEKISKRLSSTNYQLVDVIKYEGVSRLVSILKCPNCESEFEIGGNLLYDRTVRNETEICILCNPNDKNISGKETQLFNFISDNYDGEILSNSRKVINPYELDIYLPDLKLAFEFNGLYWHSELHKDKTYHYDKTKMCEDIGVQLIHIWEDNWVMNRELIESMVLNKLNKSSDKIYARKCVVKEILDNKLIREFLDNNHIQGFVGSKIKIGLYHDDELVSLMTFGGLRSSMGYKSKQGDYELMRFCNKLKTSVIGGASKLFKYFIRNYKYNMIISYSDNSYSNGSLYETIGFCEIKQDVKLNYYWVIDKQRQHRYNYRKSNLIKMGYDKDKSEREIMYEDVGSYRIWGSGNKKWEYINSDNNI